jgi:hypothetical protein
LRPYADRPVTKGHCQRPEASEDRVEDGHYVCADDAHVGATQALRARPARAASRRAASPSLEPTRPPEPSGEASGGAGRSEPIRAPLLTRIAAAFQTCAVPNRLSRPLRWYAVLSGDGRERRPHAIAATRSRFDEAVADCVAG